VTSPRADVVLPTRRLDPALLGILRSLAVGDRIRMIRSVRVGSQRWVTTTAGSFRGIAYLNTGITTERVREDDLVVPVLQFTKSNGELSSVTIDEHLAIEKV
jgi:hypothetical protein